MFTYCFEMEKDHLKISICVDDYSQYISIHIDTNISITLFNTCIIISDLSNHFDIVIYKNGYMCFNPTVAIDYGSLNFHTINSLICHFIHDTYGLNISPNMISQYQEIENSDTVRQLCQSIIQTLKLHLNNAHFNITYNEFSMNVGNYCRYALIKIINNHNRDFTKNLIDFICNDLFISFINPPVGIQFIDLPIDII